MEAGVFVATPTHDLRGGGDALKVQARPGARRSLTEMEKNTKHSQAPRRVLLKNAAVCFWPLTQSDSLV